MTGRVGWDGFIVINFCVDLSTPTHQTKFCDRGACFSLSSIVKRDMIGADLDAAISEASQFVNPPVLIRVFLRVPAFSARDISFLSTSACSMQGKSF